MTEKLNEFIATNKESDDVGVWHIPTGKYSGMFCGIQYLQTGNRITKLDSGSYIHESSWGRYEVKPKDVF